MVLWLLNTFDLRVSRSIFAWGNVPHRLVSLVGLVCFLQVAVSGCTTQSSVSVPQIVGADSQSSAPRLTDTVESPRASRPGDWFEDVTNSTGIDWAYRNGQESNHFTLLESVGGGVALFDFDRDGDTDVFCPGGGSIEGSQTLVAKGRPGALFRNDGNLKFTNVTEASGLGVVGDYSHGCTVADFDRDGWPDLLVTCFGQCQLFHNEQNGRFREMAVSAGVVTTGWCVAAAWGDFDRDGWADLFVTGYLDWKPDAAEYCGNRERGERDVCLPNSYPAAPSYLFRNQRDGTFENVTDKAGIRHDGRGMGVVAFDFNRDGWLDYYVANDAGANQLYLGSADLRFTEDATAAGCAFNEVGIPDGSMGVDVFDYADDGIPDLFVTNFEFEENALYRNDGTGHFMHASVIAGLSGRCRRYVKFGVAFADFDLDGWQDLMISNGHVLYRRPPVSQPPILYKNVDGKRFRDISTDAGPYFSIPHMGRGVGIADLDQDGKIDLVIVHQNAPVTVLRNLRPAVDWFDIGLKGVTSNPDGIGATVTAQFPDRPLTRFVIGGGGYLSHFAPQIRFPLQRPKPQQEKPQEGHRGSEKPQVPDVLVQWPTGRTERFVALHPCQLNLLVEGTGEPQ